MRNDVGACCLKVFGFIQPYSSGEIHELTAEPDIGLLLPCNVLVREDAGGAVTVSFMDPVAVLQLTQQPEVAIVAKEVRQRLERVRSIVAAHKSTKKTK